VDLPFELYGDTEGCGLSFGFLDVTLSPTTAAPGGAVTISGSLYNQYGFPWDLALFLDYERESGGPSGTLLLAEGTVPPGTFPFSVTRRVPGNAPGGTYDLLLRLTEPVDGETCSLWPLALTVTPTPLGSGIPEGRAIFETTAPSEGLFASATPQAPVEVVVSPNPFAALTTLHFALAEAAEVRLAVYDALGREVAVLLDRPLGAGRHAVKFDGRGLAAGAYGYRLVAAGRVETGRLTLMR
jgi:hypothetical protein